MQKLIRSKLSQKRKAYGFTLLELTVASVVAFAILGVSTGMLVELRRQILGDRIRSTVNDNLRIASEMIGTDIKQAGERLESDTELPGISIIPGVATSTDPAPPSTLILQRQLLPEKLTACQNIAVGPGGTTTIDVAVKSNTPATSVSTCPYSYSAPAGGELPALTSLAPSNNLRAWRTYRCTQGLPFSGIGDPCSRTVNVNPAATPPVQCAQLGGTDKACAWAYIRNPTTKVGEFFLYSYESFGTCNYYNGTIAVSAVCQRIHRADGNTWRYSYTYDPTKDLNQQPQIYILEERAYSLLPDTSTTIANDYILQLSVNQQSPQRIANQFTNFLVSGILASGSVNSYNSDQKYLKATDWKNLVGVRITLNSLNPNSSQMPVNSGSNYLTLTSQFLSRNAFSTSPTP